MTRELDSARGPLRGTARVPGDKSIAHRALILGALSEDGLVIRNLPPGLDVGSTRLCLGRLGAEIVPTSGGVHVRGDGLRRPWKASPAILDCGNSGTTMRLLMGVLAGMPIVTVLTGDASLSRRPMRRVAEPLRSMGSAVDLHADEFAPVRIVGRRPLARIRYRLPVASAQVKSAILLAALFGEGETVVHDPFGTRDHTERMLRWLAPGAIHAEGEEVVVTPSAVRGGGIVDVPGDPSSAAYVIAAATLVPGSEIVVEGMGVNPTRVGFVEVLREWGARIEMENPREAAGEPVADLRVSHAPLRAGTVRAERIPGLVDEVPLLAVVAAASRGTARLEGLGELRLKESDRLEGTASGLRAMGVEAGVDGNTLVVRGARPPRGARIATRGDHRLAMAFSVAALVARERTSISDAGCVAVSYPGFYEELARLAS